MVFDGIQEGLPIEEMAEPSIHSQTSGRALALMGVLLADATVDVELVSRELGLTDAMSERLRRTLDRPECVAAVLETMCSAAAGCESTEVPDAARCAVGELAARWPLDYSSGAVEWVVLAS